MLGTGSGAPRNNSTTARAKSSTDRSVRPAVSADGRRLTATRQGILEILAASDCPLGAYALLRALAGRTGRPVRPPTVYRALEFLSAQGLAKRIASRNAFVACMRPERAEVSAFFLCNTCGAAAEFDDPRIDGLLADDASTLGFRMTRRVLEIEGTCLDCLGDDTPGAPS